MLALAWPVGLAVCATWLAAAAISRTSSMAALIAAGSSTAWMLLLDNGTAFFLGVILTCLIYWRHRTNISRLRAGTEPKIGQKKANPHPAFHRKFPELANMTGTPPKPTPPAPRSPSSGLLCRPHPRATDPRIARFPTADPLHRALHGRADLPGSRRANSLLDALARATQRLANSHRRARRQHPCLHSDSSGRTSHRHQRPALDRFGLLHLWCDVLDALGGVFSACSTTSSLENHVAPPSRLRNPTERPKLTFSHGPPDHFPRQPRVSRMSAESHPPVFAKILD